MILVRKNHHMSYKGLIVLSVFFCMIANIKAQETDKKENEPVVLAMQSDSIPLTVPEINYNSTRNYEIADIAITGLQNKIYDDFALINFSGLTVGDVVEIPGQEVTNAVKRFWRQGLFSDIKILASQVQKNKIWIEIRLKERPLISAINFTGMKKGERKDLKEDWECRSTLRLPRTSSTGHAHM